MIEGLGRLLNYLVIVITSVGICQEKVVKEKWKWVVGGCLYIVAGFFHLGPIGGAKSNLISLLIAVIAYLILIQKNGVKQIAVYLFCRYYLRVLYGGAELMVSMMVLPFPKLVIISEILETLLVLLGVLVISFQIRKSEEWVRRIENIPSAYYFIGFFCAFIATGLLVYIELELGDENVKMQMLGKILLTITEVFFYLMGLAIAVTNLFRKEYKEQNLLKDEYLRLSKKHYETLSDNMKEICSLRHDMKSHLSSILYFIETQEWERMKNYVEEISGEIARGEEAIVNVNHDLVNAILAENLKEEEEIHFQCEGMLPTDLKIEDFDLCIIFSNLISNSIEACEQLTTMKKEIILQIKKFQNNLHIYMENPVQNNVDIRKSGGVTTKEDKLNHGHGINNILKTVKKYEGDAIFRCENNRFMVEISFFAILK